MTDEICQKAMQIAAQCWCDPETENIVMNTVLCRAFATRIEPLLRLEDWANRAYKAWRCGRPVVSAEWMAMLHELDHIQTVDVQEPTGQRGKDAEGRAE